MMINFNPRLPLKDGCLPIALKDADPRYHKGMPRPAPKKGKKWATALMWALVAAVALAMAAGCRRLCGSDLAVSVTGLAGPEGDDRGNAVGTVFIALDWGDGARCRRLDLGPGRGREHIRSAAAQHVFDLLRRHLLGLPV